jgi:hypothetical protein
MFLLSNGTEPHEFCGGPWGRVGLIFHDAFANQLSSTCLLSMLLVIRREREGEGMAEGRGEKRGSRKEREEREDIRPYRNCIGVFYYVLWLGQHLS